MAEINKDDLVSKEALAVIDELRTRVKQLQDALILAQKAGRELGSELGNQDKISKMAGDIQKLNANILSLTASASNLAAAKKALTEATKVVTEAEKSAAKATNESTKSKTSATAANKAAEQSAKNEANARKQAAGAIRLEAFEIRSATALLNAKTAAEKASARATNNSTKASKEGAVASRTLGSSFKSLIGALGQLAGAYFTIQGAIALFKKFRDSTKDLDSLRFSMEATIKNTFELAQTQYYLLDISKKFGLGIVDITNSYTKFRAAVNESNMTINEGQKVFASMAKASAVLGMTMDKTNDVFLALEQMVGKGSIMSEELRRQMGQHLPVAMTAMAQAAKMAGISVSGSVAELMKLMKAGKVVASDVLPYFGDAVEEQLGIKGVNAVETLATAQANLTLAWMEFVKAMDKAPILAKVYRTIGESVQWAADIMKSEAQKTKEGAGSIVSDVNDELVRATTEKERQLILDEEIIRLEQRKIDLGVEQQNAIANDPNKPKPGFKNMSRNILGLVGVDKQRFDATFPELPNRELEKYINEADAVSEALRLIYDNYDELIKIKEKDPIIPDPAAIKKAKDDALKIFKDGQAEELANYIQFQQEMRAQAYMNVTATATDDIEKERADAGLKMDMEKNITDFKLAQNQKLQEYVKSDRVEVADAQRVAAQIERDLASKTTDFKISEFDREFKTWLDNKKKIEAQEKKDLEDKKDRDIAAIETRTTGNILTLAGGLPTGPIKDKRAYGAVETKFNIDVLEEQKRGLIDLLAVENLTINESSNMQQKLDDTEAALEKAKRERIQQTYDLQKELTAEAFKYGSQAMNETFNLFSGLQDAQMQRLEWQHDREVNLAGTNVAKKIAAENKYAEEKGKLQRRQAILAKAQAVSNIIMNTAEAIMATLGETGIFGLPLTPIIAGIGAISLATALAQPIPKYEKGGRHEGGVATFSEQGRELFIPDGNGNPLLTPRKETTAIMPAGTFVTSDETQRLLAQGAMDNFMRTDMTPTNSLLKVIADKSETKYVNGFKITKTGRYVTRG